MELILFQISALGKNYYHSCFVKTTYYVIASASQPRRKKALSLLICVGLDKKFGLVRFYKIFLRVYLPSKKVRVGKVRYVPMTKY